MNDSNLKLRKTLFDNFNSKNFTYLFLLFVLGIVSFYLFQYLVIEMRGWNLGDWLINYQDGGFKRRGLGGFIFLGLGNLLNVKPNYLVFLFVEIIWIFLLYQIFLFIKNSKTDVFGFLFLLLLPIGLLFNIVSVGAIGRKEILLCALFAFYLWGDSKKIKYLDIVTPILLFIITLFHELTLFYIGYFLLIKYINNNKKYWVYITYVLSVLIPVLLIYLFGKPINNGLTFYFLKKFEIILTPGILDFNENADLMMHYKNHFGVYLEYGFPIFIAVISILWFTKIYGKEYEKLLKYFVLIFFISLPLFYLALDWGRWINIHFMMIILVFLYQNLKLNKKINISFNEKLLMILFIFINSFWQMEVNNNGFRLNYFLEILLSKIS